MADKTAEETGPPSDTDFTTPSPITFRVAVGPSGEHGYEIGHWQAGADPGNPSHFVVLEGCYDQVEAAQRALVLNRQWMAGQATPMHQPAEKEEDDDDDEAPHRRGGRRR